MAGSGSFTGTTANSAIVPTIAWSAAQSQEGNYSDVTAVLTYDRTNSGYTTYGTWSGSITINGAATAGSRYLEIGYQTYTEAIRATVRVYHEADGSRSVTISAAGGISGTSLSSTEIAASVTLNTIPRASALSFGTFTLGAAAGITVQAASESFHHTIRCALGSKSAVIADRTSARSVSWTMPLAWAAELPESTAGTGTLTVETYQGSTLIGSRSYACTVYVPESLKPSGTLTVSVVNEGAAADWGVCIRGRSSLSYQAAVTGAYGAAVRTCRVSFSGASADGLSGTVGPAERSGSQKATAVVTDARGRSVTLTSAAVEVLDYYQPVLETVSVGRCGADGTLQTDGAYVRILCTARCAPCGGHNALTLRARYRRVGGSWGAYQSLTSGAASVLAGFETTGSYEVELTASDSLGGSKTILVPVSTAEVTLHLRSGGKGAAFGKYSEKEALECAWDAEFQGEVQAASLRVGGRMLLDWIYPIGAVYISASATDPKTLFGGTWTRIKDRFLLAAGDTFAAGKTGGEASHTLTVDEIPDHTHSYQYTGQSTVIGTDTIRLYDRNGQPNQYTGQQSSNCGGKAHNNMPPYLAVYVWRRTS